MINKEKIIAIIPARGGSKRIHRKNLRIFNEKPLFIWTLLEALKVPHLDKIVVSTEDSEIAEIAQTYGCDEIHKRNPSLALDDTLMIDVVIDVIKHNPGYDWVLLLQPTSPLRTHMDIQNAIDLCIESNKDACISVTEINESPEWMYTIQENLTLSKLMVSNESNINKKNIYILNGAIFFQRTQLLMQDKKLIPQNAIPYKMSKDKSVDIDTELDFFMAECLMKRLS